MKSVKLLNRPLPSGDNDRILMRICCLSSSQSRISRYENTPFIAARDWPQGKEYTEERVSPKNPLYPTDFKGAKWIWSDDLDLDNTVLFRVRIDKPGWNMHPDLDLTGAPVR